MVEYRRLLRQRWFDYGPKFVGYEWFRHGRRILDHKVSLGTLSLRFKHESFAMGFMSLAKLPLSPSPRALGGLLDGRVTLGSTGKAPFGPSR
jgi:hypothetical protein